MQELQKGDSRWKRFKFWMNGKRHPVVAFLNKGVVIGYVTDSKFYNNGSKIINVSQYLSRHLSGVSGVSGVTEAEAEAESEVLRNVWIKNYAWLSCQQREREKEKEIYLTENNWLSMYLFLLREDCVNQYDCLLCASLLGCTSFQSFKNANSPSQYYQISAIDL